MALILSLETAVRNCSVAIHNRGALIASQQIEIPQSHASNLAVLVNDVTKTAGIDITRLDAVAVSSGPGSYTGLRIGASTAKGLCFGLNKPLIAINTLDILAFQMKEVRKGNELLCPMIDARRMEVYCKILDHGKEFLPMNATVVDEHIFLNVLEKHKVLFFGDGAMKCKEVIHHPNAFFVDDVYPLASAMGSMAFDKFKGMRFEDLKNFEPDYLKEFLIRKPKTQERAEP